ncbi:MAG: efflux RND transporter permease subunit [Phycisphaeraceae bacterium]
MSKADHPRVDTSHGPLAWFARNRVASNLLMIFVLLTGALSLWRMQVEVFPELSADMVTVRVPYPGASPSEVEEGVVVRVEEAVEGVEGIERLRSVASEGIGTVMAELEESADHPKALDDIKSEVDRIDTFPEHAEEPVITEVTNRIQVVTVAVYGDVSEKTLKVLGQQVRDDLAAKPNISQVEIAGVRPYEISIEISEPALRRYGLSFDELARIVRQASLDLPGGSLETRGGEVLIRTKSQRYTGREFERIPVITTNSGTTIRLGDIATVYDGFEATDVAARFDGKPALMVNVFRVGDQGALDVAGTVYDYIEQNQDRLEDRGISLAPWFDRSEYLESRINLLVRNAAIGLALVFLCLAAFLDLRLAMWTTMGIPISFFGAFFLLPMLGVTINMISLFALIIVLGIVVDDAIVVGENIYALRQRGLGPLAAAVQGVREMAVPVTIAVLTTIAAFVPMLFTAGEMGKVMRTVPLVVISVLAFSLVEALLILPAHLSGRWKQGEPGRIGRLQKRLRDSLQRFIEGPYLRTLKKAVRYRYLTLATSVAAFLVVVGAVAGGHLKFVFFPDVDADNVVAVLTMPQGTPLEETEAVVARLENAAAEVGRELAAEHPDHDIAVRHMATTLGEQPFSGMVQGGHISGTAGGTGDSNLAEINVELLSGEERDFASTEFADRWRERVGDIPGVSELTFISSFFSSGSPVHVELAHRDFDQLVAASEDLKKAVARYTGVSDITDSFEPGKLELQLELSPQARNLGVTEEDLARQVRQGFYGAEIQRIQRGQDEVKVMLRYPEQERRSLADIERMRIRLPDGRQVPFSTIAEVELGRGYAAMDRTDRMRVVKVTADVDTRTADANAINTSLRQSVLPEIASQYPGLSYSFEGEQREQNESLNSLGLNFLIALAAIFVLLAIQFRSYTQPLIIMSAIPFGLVGAVIGHVIMGYNLSLLSAFGAVALTGVVVNDSLIMIDLINRERREGVGLTQVIRDSGVRRFRPILLTTLTTFFGLMPMILETSLQARFLIPMAISLGFGVLFATAITLLLVPSLYMILEDIHDLLGITGGHEAAIEPASAGAPSPEGNGQTEPAPQTQRQPRHEGEPARGR